MRCIFNVAYKQSAAQISRATPPRPRLPITMSGADITGPAPPRSHDRVAVPDGFGLLSYDHEFQLKPRSKSTHTHAVLNLFRGTLSLCRGRADSSPTLYSTDVHIDRTDTSAHHLVLRGTFLPPSSLAFCLRVLSDAHLTPRYQRKGAVHAVSLLVGPPHCLEPVGTLFAHNPFPSTHPYTRRASNAAPPPSTVRSILDRAYEYWNAAWHGSPLPIDEGPTTPLRPSRYPPSASPPVPHMY